MEKTFKVASYNEPDSQGDVFAPGCFKSFGKVWVLKDFEMRHPIGKAEIKSEPDGLYARAEIKEENSGLYPAIGFQVLSSRVEGDVRIIDEIKLYCVSLGSSNVDPTIPPIK